MDTCFYIRMDTVKQFSTSIILLSILFQDVTGICPVNNITSVIDMCSKGSVTDFGIFVDISEMPRDVSSCACTISSEVAQKVQFTTMEVFDVTPRDCEFYTYSLQNPLSTDHMWTCQNPEGFEFTSEKIDPKVPWTVNMTKTLSGLFSAPLDDPNYCVILVAIEGLGQIRLDCGETTPVGILPSTSTVPTTFTSLETTGAATSSRVAIDPTVTSTPTAQSTIAAEDNTDNNPTSPTTTSSPSDEEPTKPATQAQLEPGNPDSKDTGLGIIIGGIFAGVILFFLIATACYFYNRRSKKQEDESDRVSVITSTTNTAGYPYRQQGGRYVYYLDTSSYKPDYLYVYPTGD